MRSHARRCPSLSFASVRKGARLEAREFGAEVNEDAGFRMRPDHMDDTREQIDASIGSASSLPAALACGEESAPPRVSVPLVALRTTTRTMSSDTSPDPG